ncbi:replication-associated recombination protein A [Paenibacillus apiarius]|uniref:Replication-associated recombination protein A n=1 Tax=Paenibacillus apiarius TaxID=46240 RepID=A0ABT4DZ36_9BACL|nr:replication-associated recombination protein A [Paenibacillus apiarius]MCY9512921.1 replication-associated recombination protein A [Paenibacillus apiarius]MCY9522030.1 replication-associated recombination protein A [Paenibacillus apiarius]MCY9555075.1 replication-associated recombination protein A [Paenibacillus apiarius]MCY9558095.1 replication-associated recombination protein A [Paenibacillus apiarius]MCY9686767.1 replication-associated recombination protein A [Paenibacillus apiarius]
MDLFSYQEDREPGMRLLADRMRPRTLDQYIGQEHIVGQGRLLRRAIEADRVSSIILYGPPGCGKTTLANIISEQTQGEFVRLNAVDASVKDVRAVIEQAETNKHMYNTKTILFLDEVHRFNRSQQDALLPAVEKGTIIFIGATTENPFHHVNGALMSRSTLFQLKALTKEHSLAAMKRALTDKEQGLGFMPIKADPGALQHIASMANGDIRRALNALELAAMTTTPEADGTVHITVPVAEESVRRPSVQADESVQYDVLSAFHKSIRGSSDAALFWFLYAVEKLGMDPMTFIRRLTVACSEDIGLANPQAMVQAVSALEAYHRIGWPESKYIISQAILFAAESPKSNSIPLAIARVMQAFDDIKSADVPLHLRDTHYKGADKLGHKGYQYPHDYPGHYVEQQYLPDSIKNRVFFMASEQGTEAKMRINQERRRNPNDGHE